MMLNTQKTGIPDIVAPSTEVITLAEGMVFCEGPVWDKRHDRIIFSDTEANEHKFWSQKNGLQTLRQPSFYPNGNVFDLEGNMLTCEHESRAISITDLNGKRTILIDKFEGKRFNSPNDLEVRSDGTVWFTDPTYGLGDREQELDFNGVFCFQPKTGDIFAIAKDFVMPNGIAFSPDEQKLYVGDSAENNRKNRIFTLDNDGIVAGGETLCQIDHHDW